MNRVLTYDRSNEHYLIALKKGLKSPGGHTLRKPRDHHRTHAHNHITREGIRQPCTGVSSLISAAFPIFLDSTALLFDFDITFLMR